MPSIVEQLLSQISFCLMMKAASLEHRSLCCYLLLHASTFMLFSARPDRTWGPHSQVGTGSLPGVKWGRGVLLTIHPLLVPWSWKSRAIPLPTLWATPDL